MMRSAFLALALAAVGSYADDSYVINSDAYANGDLGAYPLQSYKSSNLTPPEIDFLSGFGTSAISSSNYTFLGYRGDDDVPSSPAMLDNNGSLVWSGLNDGWGPSMDFRVQYYKGEPVLTFFQGAFDSPGVGSGEWVVLGANYSEITSFYDLNYTAKSSDFHEMVLTDNDTALVESWRVTSADLTAVGGPADGWTWDCVFQETTTEPDPSARTVLFEWHSLDHVPVEQTYFGISDNAGSAEDDPFDYCHINSLEKTNDGNYLVSMRGPSTIYHISAETGEIIWYLSGKSTSFTMNTDPYDATFWYQHDARLHGDITASKFNISLFDNAAGGDGDAEQTARGLILELDTDAMTATVMHQFIPSFMHTAESQGNINLLDNGNAIVGWGSEPYFTEYSIDDAATNGTIVYDGMFGALNTSVQSYRTHRMAWYGAPTTSPNASVETASNGSTTVYVSWNGATNVTEWHLMAGSDASSLSDVSTTMRDGFETVITSPSSNSYFSVAAVAGDGTCIGTTNVYSSDGTDSGSAGACPDGGAPKASSSGSSSSSSGSSDGENAAPSVHPATATVLATLALAASSFLAL